LGKVIGRGGRVAQALRTIVRAGAEGRVTIDIVDSGEEDDGDLDHELDAPVAVAVAEPLPDADEEAAVVAEAPAAKKKAVRKRKPKAAVDEPEQA
jgi:hypothetical protein